MSASAIGGSVIAPIAPPDITTASAVPRRRSNQLETAREYAIGAVPFPTMPRTDKNDEDRVEMPEVRRQKSQGGKCASEDRQTRNDDPARTDPIEQVAEKR